MARDGSQNVCIVTDTTASLQIGWAEEHGVRVAPQVILFGEESFLEERELSFPDFVRRLSTSPSLPRTAAPPPGEFVELYREALADASTVLSIHPSSDVSGTVRSAETARSEAFPDADIRILDTRVIGGGLASLVCVAVEMAEAHASADEIMAELRRLIPRNRTYFAVRTLEYLRRGGRIGRASAWAGSLLSIKPVLQLADGVVAPLEKVRTFSRAQKRIEDLVTDECPHSMQSRLTVMHADAEAEAQSLAERLASALHLDGVAVATMGAAITTHAGPGVVGVSFFV